METNQTFSFFFSTQTKSLLKAFSSVFLFLFLFSGYSYSLENAGNVKIEKNNTGIKPVVTISSVNSKTVKKYEKFEVILGLKNYLRWICEWHRIN